MGTHPFIYPKKKKKKKELILSLIEVWWVFPKTVKKALLDWRDSFVDKKRGRRLEVFATYVTDLGV